MQGHALHKTTYFCKSLFYIKFMPQFLSLCNTPVLTQLDPSLFPLGCQIPLFSKHLFSAKTNRNMHVGQYMNHNIPYFLYRKRTKPSALPLNYSKKITTVGSLCQQAQVGLSPINFNSELPSSVWGYDAHVAYNTSQLRPLLHVHSHHVLAQVLFTSEQSLQHDKR